MIAAAEQSKQFIIPTMHMVIDLKDWKPQGSSYSIFFDGGGTPLKEVLHDLDRQVDEFIACVGPEGDLTKEEKHQLKDQGFIFCALTPTILRAKQSIAVGLGVLRFYQR